MGLPLLTKNLFQLIPTGKGKVSFLQWSLTGYISHSSGQNPCLLDQHSLSLSLSLNSIFVDFCLIFLLVYPSFACSFWLSFLCFCRVCFLWLVFIVFVALSLSFFFLFREGKREQEVGCVQVWGGPERNQEKGKLMNLFPIWKKECGTGSGWFSGWAHRLFLQRTGVWFPPYNSSSKGIQPLWPLWTPAFTCEYHLHYMYS